LLEEIDVYLVEEIAENVARGMSPEEARRRVITDPHPLGRFRVNGPLSNMPAFAAAFQCKSGDVMVRAPEKRCQIW